MDLKTVAYLDTQDATLSVVKPSGKTVRTFVVPPNIVASAEGRQGAWARSILSRHGFTPTRTVNAYPYGIAVPLA